MYLINLTTKSSGEEKGIKWAAGKWHIFGKAPNLEGRYFVFKIPKFLEIILIKLSILIPD